MGMLNRHHVTSFEQQEFELGADRLGFHHSRLVQACFWDHNNFTR
jgi:hypothetical protein